MRNKLVNHLKEDKVDTSNIREVYKFFSDRLLSNDDKFFSFVFALNEANKELKFTNEKSWEYRCDLSDLLNCSDDTIDDLFDAFINCVVLEKGVIGRY